MEVTTETKFGTRLPTGWEWCPNLKYTHRAERARDTTLND